MNKSNTINVLTIKTPAFKNRIDISKLEILHANALDKNVQCNLLETPFYLELRSFSFEEKNKRKFLLRHIFGWIILQNVIYLPFMYLCVQNQRGLFRTLEDFEAREILLGVDIIISTPFYYFRNYRRPTRNSYLSLILVTILTTVLMGVYANAMSCISVVLQPIILILQLSAVVVFSFQSKFELTYFLALIIILAVYLVFIILNIFIIHNNELYIIGAFSSLTGIYILFDTQIMFTSPLHGYRMDSNEHVFGAVNLFADQSKLAWLLFRFSFFDNTISICRNIFKTLMSKLY